MGRLFFVPTYLMLFPVFSIEKLATFAKAAADAEKSAIDAFGYVCIYALEDGKYKWIDSHSRTGQNSSIRYIVLTDGFQDGAEVKSCANNGYVYCVWYTIEPAP